MLRWCHIGGMAEPTLNKCFPVHCDICRCTLAHHPMPEGTLFTNLGPPASLDIVYMTGAEISRPELSREREQCPKADRQDVRADRNLLIQ